MMSWGGLFFFLLMGGLAAWGLARRGRASTGLPTGRLVYADITRWQPQERPLFSRPYRLSGRPDYLLQRRHGVIPVEVKSGRAPDSGPYTAHILQLAAYCLLVEEAFGRRPPYGIIVYADDAEAAFEIEYTRTLEGRLLTTLDAMRSALAEGDAPRDHDHVARCRACSYRSACSQSLA